MNRKPSSLLFFFFFLFVLLGAKLTHRLQLTNENNYTRAAVTAELMIYIADIIHELCREKEQNPHFQRTKKTISTGNL